MTTMINYPGDRTGLLLVDPYNDFLSEGGKLWPRLKASLRKRTSSTICARSWRQHGQQKFRFSSYRIVAGSRVTHVNLGDPLSWNAPHDVEETLAVIKQRWPAIKHFKLHLHNARGMAMASTYAALRVLEATDTVYFDGTIGGIGGCPYCGNGRATGMVATEDLMHLLQRMGIETGVDLNRVIDCSWMLEEMLGRLTPGHVSKAGPCPINPEDCYDPNMPFVESFEQARHFRLGPKVYADGHRPWKEAISRPRVA